MTEKKKRATPWKSGKIISIRLRNGVYVLAQMVRDPYLLFFKHFSQDNDWSQLTLKKEDILFCKAVTRQFLRFSPVTIVKNLAPLENYHLPKEWIYPHMGGSPVRVTVKGREYELMALAAAIPWWRLIRIVGCRKIILSWGSFRLISSRIFKNRTGPEQRMRKPCLSRYFPISMNASIFAISTVRM